MPDEDRALDPALAATAEEYVALLRRLRDRSGLTYRQLQRRAEAAGDVLPPSTAASALARSSLPREELVVALVRACGATAGEVDGWIAARTRIAATDGAEVSPVPAPADEPVEPEPVEPEATAPARRFPLAAVLITAVVVASVTAAAFLWLGRPAQAPAGGVSGAGARSGPTATPPATVPSDQGAYRFRAAHSGLCLSERRGQKSGTVYQADCATAIPAMRLRLTHDGVYEIETDHPDYGLGCSGVAGASTVSGAPLEDGECDRPAAKDFALEPLDEPAGTFRLRLPHSRLCVGVLDGLTAPWTPVVQMPCVPGAAGQAFYLDPVAKEAATAG